VNNFTKDKMRLIEGKTARIDLLVRAADAQRTPRTGLGPADVGCYLKRPGASTWTPKELTPANWQEAGHGLYVLTLDPAEFDATGDLAIFVEGRPDLQPGIVPILEAFDVVEGRPIGMPPIPQTTLCGRVLSLDQKGKPKAVVFARVAQLPLIIGGAAVCNDPLTVETNEDGYFELTVITGAVVQVQITAINYQRQFVVPPPPAPGVPVRLFSL
jgi:hypothetical protein